MNAMQRYKESSGKSFPTYREVIKVVVGLGYRRAVLEPDPTLTESCLEEPVLITESTVDA